MIKTSSEDSRHSLPRIILGIDPGLAFIGYAFVREFCGHLTLLACDVIRTPTNTPLEGRLLTIYEQMTILLNRYHPTEAAIETSLFCVQAKQSAIQVAHARGVLLLTLSERHLPIAEYSPSEVKFVVAGYGRAKKPQVGERVRLLLQLPRRPRPDDAADAAAIAICHATVTTRPSRFIP